MVTVVGCKNFCTYSKHSLHLWSVDDIHRVHTLVGYVLYWIVVDCIALCCIVVDCIALCCIVVDCTVVYCTVFYCNLLYCIILYCSRLYCIALYCIVVCCVVLYGSHTSQVSRMSGRLL